MFDRMPRTVEVKVSCLKKVVYAALFLRLEASAMAGWMMPSNVLIRMETSAVCSPQLYM